jgi:hypothetical protein
MILKHKRTLLRPLSWRLANLAFLENVQEASTIESLIHALITVIPNCTFFFQRIIIMCVSNMMKSWAKAQSIVPLSM